MIGSAFAFLGCFLFAQATILVMFVMCARAAKKPLPEKEKEKEKAAVVKCQTADNFRNSKKKCGKCMGIIVPKSLEQMKKSTEVKAPLATMTKKSTSPLPKTSTKNESSKWSKDSSKKVPSATKSASKKMRKDQKNFKAKTDKADGKAKKPGSPAASPKSGKKKGHPEMSSGEVAVATSLAVNRTQPSLSAPQNDDDDTLKNAESLEEDKNDSG